MRRNATLADLNRRAGPGPHDSLGILDFLAVDLHPALLDQAVRGRRALDQTGLLQQSCERKSSVSSIVSTRVGNIGRRLALLAAAAEVLLGPLGGSRTRESAR